MKQFNSEVEMIEYVVTKLDEQGFRSTTGNNNCKYTGPSGSHCAAGWLMTDAELCEAVEGRLSSDCGVDFGSHTQMVRMLQIYHDEKWSPMDSTFRSLLVNSDVELPGLVVWRDTQKAATND